jgi:hypothetical protein
LTQDDEKIRITDISSPSGSGLWSTRYCDQIPMLKKPCDGKRALQAAGQVQALRETLFGHERGPGHRRSLSRNEGMKFSELYQLYQSFCESEGFEKVFPKRVPRGMLEKEGFEVGNSSRHNNQLFVSGVKVTSPPDKGEFRGSRDFRFRGVHEAELRSVPGGRSV